MLAPLFYRILQTEAAAEQLALRGDEEQTLTKLTNTYGTK